MPIISKSYVDLDHGQVHVRTCGDASAPAIVLLHQVPSSSAMWLPLMQPLADRGYRAIAIDLPGYGASDPVSERPELEDYARVVRDTVEALGHTTAFLAGHHTGSDVALILAGQHPDFVTAAAVWGVSDVEPEFLRTLADEQPPVLDLHWIDHLSGWWWRRAKYLTPAGDPTVMARALTELAMSGINAPHGHNAVGRSDHQAMLAGIARPVLAMTGRREMLDVVTLRAVERYPDKLELADLDDHGMDVVDDDPERFARVITQFFGRHSS